MNPYVRESSNTFYYQFIFHAYDDPVLLSSSPIKFAEFSAIKKGFEDDASQASKVFNRPYEYLAFTEIQNHTFCKITCNGQIIDPGMVALFGAIFKEKSYSPKLNIESSSRPIFGSSESCYGLYPDYIKKNIFFVNRNSFIEPNKDMVYIMENPDKEACKDLLALVKYCKEGNERGFPINKDGDRYYNPLNHEKEFLKIYERFEREPEIFEMEMEMGQDSLLLTYKVSQEKIKKEVNTSNKTKLRDEENETSKKMKIT